MMNSISYKIGLGFFIMVCINIGMAVFAIYYIDQLSNPIDRILKERYENVGAAENMIQALKQQELANSAMVEEQYDSTLVNEFNTYKNEFFNWHQQAIAGVALPREPLLLDSIKRYYKKYIAKSQGLHRMLKSDLPPPLINTVRKTDIYPVIGKIELLCNEIKTLNQHAIATADIQAKRFSRQGMVFIIVISIVAILSSIFISYRFTQSIIQPVKETTETVRKIGQGQLNQKIEITTDDEIAELGREFNRMTQRLQEYEEMNIQQILLEKKKSEAIVAGMPVSIIVTDNQNRLMLMNQRAMEVLSLPKDDWEGRPAREIVGNEAVATLLSRENITENNAEKDAARSLIPLMRDEEEHYFFARQISIPNDDGEASGYVTLLQDVTSFKNLDRLKSEFMATISHEFRTPLTSINMAVDILLREVPGPLNTEQADLLSDVKSDCQRLRHLVKDLLDLSKLESGNYQLNLQEIDPPRLIDDGLQPLRFRLSEKSIEPTIHIADDIADFSGDFRRLSRVITNLADNALQHTPPAGQIEISVRQTGNEIQTCVSDSGEGIPEDAIDLIFDKFVQLKNFKDAAKGNIGLGLAIAREIIHAHHGRIWVESEVGSGSRFYFTLPIQ